MQLMKRARNRANSAATTHDRSGSVIAAVALTAGYGQLAAVREVDIDVAAGEVVVLVGPNGAGKSTLLMTLAGAISPMSGSVLWHGKPTTASLNTRARQGLSFVPEEKSIIKSLSVSDNLRVAGVSIAAAEQWFPALKQLESRRAGLLSGGEQQMLTIARALGRKPRAIVVDELSMGLAPIIADRLVDTLRAAADQGTAVLVVEQELRRALKLADRIYVMRHGTMVQSAPVARYAENLDELERLVAPVAEATEQLS